MNVSARSVRLRLVVASIAIPMFVFLLVARMGKASESTTTGVLQPDGFVTFGLTTFGLISNIAGAAVVGFLLIGLISGDGSLASRQVRQRHAFHASTAAAIWTVVSVLQLIFTYAEFAAAPIAEALDPVALGGFIESVEQARALAIQALLASLLAGLCFRLRSTGSVALAVLLALAAIVPVPLTGHAASDGNHSLAVSTLALHVMTASVWLGGIIGLIVLAFAGRQRAIDLRVVVRRFGVVATWCLVIVTLSGVVNAMMRIDTVSQLATSTYGLLLVLKVAALVAVGVVASQYRHRTLAGTSIDVNALRRLLGTEVILMASTFAIAAVLSRTAPPRLDELAQQSPSQAVLGYDLPGAPDLANVLISFRPDGFVLIWAALAIALYVTAVVALRRRQKTWPVNRTLAWLGGWLLIAVVASGGVGSYSSALFSFHMVQHMTLSMLAPILLVLGEPIALLTRALPRSEVGHEPGPREWLTSFLRSRFARFMTNGMVAAAIFAGSIWLLYFSPLFEAAMTNHYGHMLMNAHFILTGFLFFYVLLGRDMSAKRFPYPARLGVLLITMVSHAFFGLALTNTSTVIAETYYRSLQLPWEYSLLDDQHKGAAFAWAFGELPITLVLIVLFARWVKSEERASRHEDAIDDNSRRVIYLTEEEAPSA